MLRSEQKGITLLKVLVARHTQENDIIVDFHGRTFLTAITRLTVPEPLYFIGYEFDKDCFPLAEDYVIWFFTATIAEKIPGIQEARNILQAAEIYSFATSHGQRLQISVSSQL